MGGMHVSCAHGDTQRVASTGPEACVPRPMGGRAFEFQSSDFGLWDAVCGLGLVASLSWEGRCLANSRVEGGAQARLWRGVGVLRVSISPRWFLFSPYCLCPPPAPRTGPDAAVSCTPPCSPGGGRSEVKRWGVAQCYCQFFNNLNVATLLRKRWGWWILAGWTAESTGLGGDNFFFLSTSFVLAVLGLRRCAGLCPSSGERGLLCCGTGASHAGGVPHRGAWALGCVGFVPAPLPRPRA